MEVAIAYDKFSKPEAAGAPTSLRTLLGELSESYTFNVFDRSYEDPHVSDIPHSRTEFELREIPSLVWTDHVLYRRQWRWKVRRSIDTPDVVLTQGKVGPASVRAASRKGIPSIIFIRGMDPTGTEKYDTGDGLVSNFLNTDFGGRVQFPFLWQNVADYRSGLKQATAVVANSEYTASQIRSRFGVESEVIYPPIKLSDYRVDPDPDGYITMVNPRSFDKGVDIFLDIASALPDEDFLMVGRVAPSSERNRAKGLDNVTLHGWESDMRNAYRKTKAVVAPSRFEEPFGRVAAEPMVSGIPCIVSDRGGLPEVVGETGEIVSDIESISAWTTAIDRAFDAHDPGAQRERVERFAADQLAERLKSLIDDVA